MSEKATSKKNVNKKIVIPKRIVNIIETSIKVGKPDKTKTEKAAQLARKEQAKRRYIKTE